MKNLLVLVVLLISGFTANAQVDIIQDHRDDNSGGGGGHSSLLFNQFISYDLVVTINYNIIKSADSYTATNISLSSMAGHSYNNWSSIKHTLVASNSNYDPILRRLEITVNYKVELESVSFDGKTFTETTLNSKKIYVKIK